MESIEDWQIDLIDKAIAASEAAYCPYSHYKVGAAILTEDQDIISGCNVENASYGLAICAERTAAVKAVSNQQTKWQAIAVVTANGGSPCGACRQFLYEFNPQLTVIVSDKNKKKIQKYCLSDLLVDGFGPQSLK